MTTVSQRVPTLLLGISQQPDFKKIPGQLVDALNAYPDFVNGLVKRPGTEFFGEMIQPGTDPDKSFWTNIIRDSTEKYVLQYDITAEQFKVWKHPNPRIVQTVFDTPPLLEQKSVTHETSAGPYTTDYDTAANNYNTALQNLQAKTTVLNEKQYNYKTTLDGQTTNTTVTKFFEITESYNNQGEIVQTVKDGIVENTAGLFTTHLNGVAQTPSVNLPTNVTLGNERTEEYPYLTRNGERIYEFNLSAAGNFTAAQLATALSELNTAEADYTAAETTLATARTTLEAAIVANNASIPTNGYLDTVATPNDIAVLNVVDKTFVVNKNKIPQMINVNTAGDILEAFVVMSIIQGGASYTVRLIWRNTANTVVGFNYTATASTTNPSAEAVVNSIVSLINNGSGVAPGTSTNGSGGEPAHEITATRVGNGIHLVRSSTGTYTLPFDVETFGSAHQDGIYSFAHDITTASKLPTQCVDGYRVKVSNSDEIDADDYYVKFVSSNTTLGYGPGSWEETVAPNIKYKFDPDTMPHLLTRDANGHFTFAPATYEDRIIGDDNTNPIPSFIGRQIEGVFVYRNRLGFLSGDSVILSRADDFFNFWNKTALTVSDDDPVDIDCTSTKPQTLRYVVPQSTGLVIFGQSEQFLLSTTGDIMSPKTAKVNRLSSFDTSENVAPLDTGIAIGFVNTTASNTRHFEIFDVSSDTSPKAAETSLPVSDLLPDDVDLYANDTNLSVFSLATKNGNRLYFYRYLQQGDKRAIEGWFQQELDQKIQYQYFDKGTLFVVTQDLDNKLYLNRISLQQHSDGGVVRSVTKWALPYGLGFQEQGLSPAIAGHSTRSSNVNLDRFIQGPRKIYDSATNTTIVEVPYTDYDTVLAITGFTKDATNKLTDTHPKVLLFESTSVPVANTSKSRITVSGDLRDAIVLAGKKYNMEVVLPRPRVIARSGDGYVADTSANLIIHRIKVQAGFGGPLSYKLRIAGRTADEDTISTVFPPGYNASLMPITVQAKHTIPIHQRTDNFELILIGETPYPLTLESYDWEGRYTTNFYQRQPY